MPARKTSPALMPCNLEVPSVTPAINLSLINYDTPFFTRSQTLHGASNDYKPPGKGRRFAHELQRPARVLMQRD